MAPAGETWIVFSDHDNIWDDRRVLWVIQGISGTLEGGFGPNASYLFPACKFDGASPEQQQSFLDNMSLTAREVTLNIRSADGILGHAFFQEEMSDGGMRGEYWACAVPIATFAAFFDHVGRDSSLLELRVCDLAFGNFVHGSGLNDVARIFAQPVNQVESAWHKATSSSWMYFHCTSNSQHETPDLYVYAILLSIAPSQIKKFPERLVQLARSMVNESTANLYLGNARIKIPEVVARLGVGHLIVPDLVRAAIIASEHRRT
jgi:hypothetical protein